MSFVDFDQIAAERDAAIAQLESYGIPFGGKADVALVTRCEECTHFEMETMLCQRDIPFPMPPDGFCSFGVPR